MFDAEPGRGLAVHDYSTLPADGQGGDARNSHAVVTASHRGELSNLMWRLPAMVRQVVR